MMMTDLLRAPPPQQRQQPHQQPAPDRVDESTRRTSDLHGRLRLDTLQTTPAEGLEAVKEQQQQQQRAEEDDTRSSDR